MGSAGYALSPTLKNTNMIEVKLSHLQILEEYKKAFSGSIVKTLGDNPKPIYISSILKAEISNTKFNKSGFHQPESYAIRTVERVGFLETTPVWEGPTNSPSRDIYWGYPCTYHGAVNLRKVGVIAGRTGIRLWKKGLIPQSLALVDPFQEERRIIEGAGMQPPLMPIGFFLRWSRYLTDEDTLLVEQLIKGPNLPKSSNDLQDKIAEIWKGQRLSYAITPNLVVGASRHKPNLEIRTTESLTIGEITEQNNEVHLDENYECFYEEISEAGFSSFI